ncbi:MAG: hypothetical protein ABWY95_08170, partial [Thermoleophilaceae bacterium]
MASRRHEDLQALAGPKPTAGVSDRAEQVEAPGSRAGRGSPPERATLARAADPHKLAGGSFATRRLRRRRLVAPTVQRADTAAGIA